MDQTRWNSPDVAPTAGAGSNYEQRIAPYNLKQVQGPAVGLDTITKIPNKLAVGPGDQETQNNLENKKIEAAKGLNPEEYWKIFKQQDGLFDKRIKDSQSNLVKLQEAVDKYSEKKGGLSGYDMTPLLALTDAWTGSNLARYYTPPKSEEERQMDAFKLRTLLEDRQNDMERLKLERSKNYLAGLEFKSQLELKKQQMEAKAQPDKMMDLKQKERVSKMYDSFLKGSDVNVDLTGQGESVRSEISKIAEAIGEKPESFGPKLWEKSNYDPATFMQKLSIVKKAANI